MEAARSAPRSFGPKSAFAVLGIYLGSQFWYGFMVAAVLGAFYAFRAVSNHQKPDVAAIQARTMLPVLIFSAVFSAGGGIAFSLVRGRGRVRDGSPAGFGVVRPRPAHAFLALLSGIALALLYLKSAPLLLAVSSKVKAGPFATLALRPGFGRLAWVLVVLAVAPWVEEYLFRGVLAAGLRERLGAVSSTALVTALFVGVHVTEAIYYWPAFISLALLGLLAAFVRERSSSVVPAALCHFGYNASIAAAVTLGTG